MNAANPGASVARTQLSVPRLAGLLEAALDATLPALAPEGASTFGVERLVESMRYSLRTPGKRIRPLLLLAVAECFGTPAQRLLRFAAGLEMIHAYSLIHDDLPAMDDDDLRRGLPTNHVVYGDGMAILAGDALLTEAFVVMLEPVVDARLQGRAVQEIARAAGREGMVGGQAADLMADAAHGSPGARAGGAEPGKREIAAGATAEAAHSRPHARAGGAGQKPGDAAAPSADHVAPAAAQVDLLQAIHARKTGALLRVAARAGGLLAGAGDADLARLGAFGEHFGLAFQIADDVKDEVAPTAVTGKREGGDRLSGKLTYPALFGVARSVAMLRTELDAALAALASLSRDATLVADLAREAVAPALAAAGD